MDLVSRIDHRFAKLMEAVAETASRSPAIADGARLLVEGLLQGGKILCCGNGGGAALAQHFATLMIHRFERERLGLPALSLDSNGAKLTAIAAGAGFEQLYARQINALGQPGDVLLLIAPEGLDPSLRQALTAAVERQMRLLLIAPENDDTPPLREHDVRIGVPGENGIRVVEIHLPILHCLCELIDIQLLGS